MEHNNKVKCSFCHLEFSVTELGKILDDTRFLLRCAKCRKDCFGGVCYVVPSECTQGSKPENPNTGKLSSLPHIIYQPQNVIRKVTNELTNWFFGEFITHPHNIIATLIPQVKLENDILRPYLLCNAARVKLLENNRESIPHRNGEELIFNLEDYSKISGLFYDQASIVLHYFYDDSKPYGLGTFHNQNPTFQWLTSAIEKSDVQLVLQLRKGTYKTFGNTINCRFDVFVGHKTWPNLNSTSRDNLKSILALFEEKFQILFNEYRANLSSSPARNASALGNSKLTNLPIVLVKTRDTFKIPLVPVSSTVVLNTADRRKVKKTQWYFPLDNIPSDYDSVINSGVPATKFDQGVPVGITSIENFFSDEELLQIESEANQTDNLARDGYFTRAGVPYTVQSSWKGERLVRTKFFFGARYLWTKEQMNDTNSNYASGIRVDVAGPPNWFKVLVQSRLNECGVIPLGFVNEYAMNIYHDGSEGLAQHFDDKSRFQRPIYSVRLFSNSRLSFGSKDFSMSNSLFFVPLSRGCITILERGAYASDTVKHCIRPQDLGGKSGALLMRQIHPNLIKEARALHRYQWFSTWLCSIPGLDEPLGYVNRFVEEELDPGSVLLLNECDLIKLGFSKMGPRKLVLQHIQSLNPKFSNPEQICDDPTCQCRANTTITGKTQHSTTTEISQLASGTVRTANQQNSSNEPLIMSNESIPSEGKSALTPRKRPFLLPDQVSLTHTNSSDLPSPPKKKPVGVAALLNPVL